MTNTLPFEFDPPPTATSEEHVHWAPATGGQHLSWPPAGVSLFIPEYENYFDWEAIEAQNGGKFKAHRRTGFSIGQYHEFIVVNSVINTSFKMGAIEATFGQITPLAAVLFDPFLDEGDFGEWSTFCSLRIIGAPPEDMEAAVLNACIRYERIHDNPPKFLDIGDLTDFSELKEVEYVVATSSLIVTNIEPLRFFYAALNQFDNSSACIYFYRVVEYFSFFTNVHDMKKLRHDMTVNDLGFAKKVLDIVTKDEKGPIFKLVHGVADNSLVSDEREIAGSTTIDRFDYQTAWGLAKAMDLHGTGTQYAIAFEFHDDIVELDATGSAEKLRFYQLKTKKSGNWTLKAIGSPTPAKGMSPPKPSFAAKMFDNFSKFGGAVEGLVFVSNQACSDLGDDHKTSA